MLTPIQDEIGFLRLLLRQSRLYQVEDAFVFLNMESDYVVELQVMDFILGCFVAGHTVVESDMLSMELELDRQGP